MLLILRHDEIEMTPNKIGAYFTLQKPFWNSVEPSDDIEQHRSYKTKSFLNLLFRYGVTCGAHMPHDCWHEIVSHFTISVMISCQLWGNRVAFGYVFELNCDAFSYIHIWSYDTLILIFIFKVRNDFCLSVGLVLLQVTTLRDR